MFSGVQYYTGQCFEIQKITEAAHKKGCNVGWDLAHAVGNIDLKLHDWKVDFACWCSYKYLNGGPGTIGGSFVHARHHKDSTLPRFSGWWGHDLATRFGMNEKEFQPIEGAFSFRLSNPPVLCVAALLASVEIFEEAKMENLRKKSYALTGYLELLLKTEIKDKLTQLTPTNPQERGCQLSLMFHQLNTSEVFERLESEAIICDVRKPNVLRVSPTPLYNSFEDVWKFVTTLKRLLSE